MVRKASSITDMVGELINKEKHKKFLFLFKESGQHDEQQGLLKDTPEAESLLLPFTGLNKQDASNLNSAPTYNRGKKTA